MKKSNLKTIITISIIAFLIMGSVGSLGFNNNQDIKKVQTRTMVRNSAFCINSLDTESSKITTIEKSGYNSYDNYIVTNNIGNESYPSMIRQGYNCLAAYEYDEGDDTSVYLRYSRTYGQTWSGPIRLNAELDDTLIEINSPHLSIIPLSDRAYGVYTSPIKNSAVFGYVEIPNILDLNVANTYTIPWTGFPDPDGEQGVTYAFWDFKTPEIISYKNTTTPWIIALIGSTNYSQQGVGPCKNSPMFCFPDLQNPDEWVALTWYSDIENCRNIDLSRNYGDSLIYGICEIKNGSNQDLLFFKGNPVLWNDTNQEFINQTITSSSSLTHPNINVTEDNIYIVADSNSDGIIMYNSSDTGDSWEIKKITENILLPNANPSFPMIYIDDDELICTFFESENLYLTTSENDGLNWSNPIQLNSINNSAVEKYQFSDLIDAHHILWTDNRDGNNDIYTVLLDVPEVDLSVVPDSVKLEYEYSDIPIIRTKNWISFAVNNSGNISVEKVNVNVFINCYNQTPQSTGYKATIYYLPSGGIESFKRPLFRITLGELLNALIEYAGIESITVTIEPKYDDIFPEDNSYSIPVTYKDIFPRLGFLESIFINF
jgi:hypothetical protein